MIRCSPLRAGGALALVLVLGLGAVAVVDPAPSTVTVERRDLIIWAEVEGRIEAIQPASLGPPPIPGMWQYRISFLAPEASEVKRGQPVVGFDTQELEQRLRHRTADRDSAEQTIEQRRTTLEKELDAARLELAEARATLHQFELDLEVPQSLVAANDLAVQRIDRDLARARLAYLTERMTLLRRRIRVELDELEDRRDAAARRVAQIQSYIGRMRVTAPRDGIVIFEDDWQGDPPKVGESTWAGRSLVQIPDLERLHAVGSVAEADLATLALDQPVTVRLDAHPTVPYTGRITRIGRSVHRRSPRDRHRVVDVDIELDTSDPERLRPGLRFQGRVETDRLHSVLTLPAAAVMATPDGPAVVKSALVGTERRSVRVGRMTPERVEILDGLKEGDRVVLRPTTDHLSEASS